MYENLRRSKLGDVGLSGNPKYRCSDLPDMWLKNKHLLNEIEGRRYIEDDSVVPVDTSKHDPRKIASPLKQVLHFTGRALVQESRDFLMMSIDMFLILLGAGFLGLVFVILFELIYVI